MAARAPRDVLILAVLVLASVLSFGLGYLAGLDVGNTGGVILETAPTAATAATGQQVVASKSGTKYYLPECAGANRISDANKVWFASAAAAASAGYTPAANCTGLSSASIK
jgi:hypothetical protein